MTLRKEASETHGAIPFPIEMPGTAPIEKQESDKTDSNHMMNNADNANIENNDNDTRPTKDFPDTSIKTIELSPKISLEEPKKSDLEVAKTEGIFRF